MTRCKPFNAECRYDMSAQIRFTLTRPDQVSFEADLCIEDAIEAIKSTPRVVREFGSLTVTMKYLT